MKSYILTYKMEFTKLSSKGQIVIPGGIRKNMNLKDGTPFAVIKQDDTILLKKIDLPEIKSWNEVTKPFRRAAKKSSFTKEDLEMLIEKVRKTKK